MTVASVPDLASADIWLMQRVLVVDDDEWVRLAIQDSLRLDGYDVLAVASGAEALELVTREQFEVVLTDLRVDHVDGLEILRTALCHAPDTVGILLTGFASLESAVEAMREGAYGYLTKPCDFVELRTTLVRGLERRRLARELHKRVRQLESANETIRVLNLELEGRVEAATAELREQLRLHGGTILAESRVGEGSMFTVRLPQ